MAGAEPMAPLKGEKITVQGIVQGVGFRPTVLRIANQLNLRGQVMNTSAGVVIYAWAAPGQLDNFLQQLTRELPPLATIESITRELLPGNSAPPENFSIHHSQGGSIHTGITADAATCQACLDDIRNPDNRRHHYPFTNCTHCGPRFSIVTAIPYDRHNTSMNAFQQCPECEQEYRNSANRRFHAQPNACPLCGPRIWLTDNNGTLLAEKDSTTVLAELAARLNAGAIAAIKGIGGFHLACDATNAAAVATLRERKHRDHKPLALMANNLAQINRYAFVGDREATLLQSSAAPIVVLQRRADSLPEQLAPGVDTLGFMLPYTPLHHLLLEQVKAPLVMTSGNLSEEPQIFDNTVASSGFGPIADVILFHNRDITNRIDDSVMRVMAGKPRFLRRARGFAPQSLALPPGFEQGHGVLAMGADLKNTFCVINHGQAVVSQHIGDLENAAAQQDYLKNLALYRQLFDFTPNRIAIDRHPGYHSSRIGKQQAAEFHCPLEDVQHHHAHLASVMAEHRLPADHEKVLGIALDGLGYGDDGSFWGGEFLLANYRSSQRLAHFATQPMLGGNQAMREPWRNTFASLLANDLWATAEREFAETGLMRFLRGKPVALLEKMARENINSFPTSSAGRLFDAVAAAVDLCRDRQAYEGQAGSLLEAAAERGRWRESDMSTNAGYPVDIHSAGPCRTLDFTGLWRTVLTDLQRETPAEVIAWRFHRGLANGIATLTHQLCRERGLKTVVMSGGVFQNRLLTELIIEQLEPAGLRLLLPEKLPANDGGLSLGQAMICLARTQMGSNNQPRSRLTSGA